jgi:hypothetical protein
MAYKHDYDKALTRLRVILQRLNDGEALGIKELANEFNVSTRTIQRDFNEKLVASYPIYQENKKWKMQDGFKIEKIRDIEDKIVLDIIEKITDGIGGNFAIKGKKLLNKIKNVTLLNIEAGAKKTSAMLTDVTYLPFETATSKDIESIIERSKTKPLIIICSSFIACFHSNSLSYLVEKQGGKVMGIHDTTDSHIIAPIINDR